MESDRNVSSVPFLTESIEKRGMSELGDLSDLTSDHFHPHLRQRMEQRGITEEEIRETIRFGWEASDAKPGTHGRIRVFTYDAQWEGTHYEEKEVTVYYKLDGDDFVLLTAIARYGSDFPRDPKAS